MVKGTVTARAVALQDLMSDLKVIDKKSISLGALELDIAEQSKRTMEEEIQEKNKVILENKQKGINITDENLNVKLPEEDKKEQEEEELKEKEKDNKRINGADDMII